MSIAWALFVPACFALNLAPGPNNLLSLNNAARHGFATASLAGGGRLLAFAGMLALVASGLALVLHTSAWLFLAIKLLGAAYLLWLAVQLWRADAQPLANEASPARPSLWRLGRQEFLVAAGNPKAILIFTAFLPQFVDPGQPLGAQFAQLGAAFLLLEWLAIALYSYAGSTSAGCSPASGPGVCSIAARAARQRGTGPAAQPPSGLTVPLRFEETHMSQSLFSLAFGVGTQNRQEAWLEVFYALPLLAVERNRRCRRTDPGYAAGNQALTFTSQQAYQLADALKGIDAAQSALLSRLAESRSRWSPPCWRKTPRRPPPRRPTSLHLLSHRLVKPHAVNLSGIFPLLPNVAWTNIGAVDLAELAELQLEARLKGKLLEVFSVDKFPKMTDYVVPAGVRIADTARVRLGAYIGEGTTVMHEGFVNFNAGTEGPGMIEGRVSAGVFVGKGSDLGGGCSTMGTLSGGGNIVISVGEGCLIGANAGIGIPLGDRNIVEAGLYITAGTGRPARRAERSGESGQGPRPGRSARPAVPPQLAERCGGVQDQQDRHRAERSAARAHN